MNQRDDAEPHGRDELGLHPEDARLLTGWSENRRHAAGVPDAARVQLMTRAVSEATAALWSDVQPGGMRVSPPGPGWSSDVDAHVRRTPDPDRLRSLGWVSLDTILGRIGSRGRGRWGMVSDGEVLAQVDLHSEPRPEPVASVLGRVRERQEVRLRDVLELRVLHRAGCRLPPGDPLVALIARAEAGLGGDQLRGEANGPRLDVPIDLSSRSRRSARAVRRRLGPKVVVAVSGVDGSGKSSLVAAMGRDLSRLGVPTTQVWARPGMRMDRLSRLAERAKRVLGQGQTPGVVRVAQGEEGPSLVSRRGPVGWAWALAVTAAFLLDVRRQHAAGRGVVLYDRHLLDALAMLDFFYDGVNTGVHRALVRAAVPRADLTVYMDVPPEVAVARKPGDAFGERAIRGQARAYARELGRTPGVVVLDATRPTDELALRVLRLLAGDADA